MNTTLLSEPWASNWGFSLDNDEGVGYGPTNAIHVLTNSDISRVTFARSFATADALVLRLWVNGSLVYRVLTSCRPRWNSALYFARLCSLDAVIPLLSAFDLAQLCSLTGY